MVFMSNGFIANCFIKFGSKSNSLKPKDVRTNDVILNGFNTKWCWNKCVSTGFVLDLMAWRHFLIFFIHLMLSFRTKELQWKQQKFSEVPQHSA
jgi:hypothetical protein